MHNQQNEYEEPALDRQAGRRWNPRFSGSFIREEPNFTDDLVTESNNDIPRRRGRGHAWFNRKKLGGTSTNGPTKNNQDERTRNDHKILFGSRGSSIPAVQTHLETSPSSGLHDVMTATDQTHDELVASLDRRGLSLEYLLRQLNNGTPLSEVLALLNFYDSDEYLTTTLAPIPQTLNPLIWGELFKQNPEMGK